MPAFVDLTGQRFGRLTVLEKTNKRSASGCVYWKCRCDCGKIKIVNGSALRSGSQQSCGCQRIDFLKSTPIHKTHGGEKERLYHVWRGMIDRCYYPSHNRYKDYGGRGIFICDEWRHDYAAFREWAMANGYDPEAPRGQCTIDRIDVDGPYAPWNCRWVSMDIQVHNRRK